jgi:hypothetical protein
VVAEELPEVIAARAVERVQTGESVVEVAAWLVDLGYWVTPEDVAVLVARHRQQQDGTGRADGGGPR